MHAQPLAVLTGGEDRRLARESREPVGGVVRSGERVAKVRVQVVEERDAREECCVVRAQVRDQQVEEPVMDLAHACRHRVDQRGRVGATCDGRQRELKAERPALGLLVQARRDVRVDALPEALARERERLFQS